MNEYSWHKVNVIFLLHDFAVYSAKLWNLSKVDPTIKNTEKWRDVMTILESSCHKTDNLDLE